MPQWLLIALAGIGASSLVLAIVHIWKQYYYEIQSEMRYEQKLILVKSSIQQLENRVAEFHEQNKLIIDKVQQLALLMKSLNERTAILDKRLVELETVTAHLKLPK